MTQTKLTSLTARIKTIVDVLFCDHYVVAIVKNKRLSTHINADTDTAGQMIDSLTCDYEAYYAGN